MRRDISPSRGGRIMALHLAALPVQRLRRERGGGDGRPLAVEHEGRIVCIDAAAFDAGVRPGQTVTEAVAACGRVELVPHAPAADLAALRALAEAMLGLVPAVEPVAPDALLLDAGAAHLLGGGRDPAAAERGLAERAVGLAAELGWSVRGVVATGKGPALALARAAVAPVRVVPRGGEPRALAPLPLAALGLDGEAGERLAGLGIASAGALAKLPAESLAHRFGAAGVAAARLARGEDGRPLVPWTPETLPEEALELEGAAESAEPVLFAVKRLADRVAARLAGRALGATRLKLVLRLDPRGEERLLVPLARPTAEPASWLAPLRERIFSLRLPGAVIGLRLAAIEVAILRAEQLAIGDRPEAMAALETVLARLAGRLGEDALFAAEPVERHRPEAAYRPIPFRRVRRGGEAGTRERAGAPAADRSAGDPDALPPPGRFRPTRLLAEPRPLIAEGEGGRLTSLRVDGRAHAVESMEGPERLGGEWWNRPFERDYWRVRLEGMGDCWIYRDGRDGRLWLHGFFD
jgi:protein ImuB